MSRWPSSSVRTTRLIKYEVSSLSHSEISELFPAESSVALLGWLSFDERFIKSAEALAHRQIAYTYFSFLESRERNKPYRRRLNFALKSKKILHLEVERENQLFGYHELRRAVISQEKKNDYLLIDVSAFPREYVCMLVSILYEIGDLSKIRLLYNQAEDYSYLEEPEKKWLSVGTRAAQPVATFSGSNRPGSPITLIVLAGFDGDRLAQIAENIDPDRLLFGVPLSSESQMEWFNKKIENDCIKIEWKHKNVERFYFNTNDVNATSDLLGTYCADESAERSVIIAPHNNKLSTLAAANAAKSSGKPQIIFAPALVYNIAAFARPSNSYLLVTMRSGNAEASG
ncbi:hypothetical protein C8J38_1021 [Rhizobium sp. PP-WC-2G-219]|nr:hypothetical protein C8J38_1021 [Rhizobium sp. PP-WC-2G-219]